MWGVRDILAQHNKPKSNPILYAKMMLAQTNIIDNLIEIWCIMHMCAINLTKLTKEKKNVWTNNKSHTLKSLTFA